MEDILIYIMFFALGYAFGWVGREAAAKRRVEKFVKELEDVEETPDELIRIKIEKHGDMFYVYGDGDSNDFMAQGATFKEIEDALAKRYPEKRFAATPENLKDMGFA